MRRPEPEVTRLILLITALLLLICVVAGAVFVIVTLSTEGQSELVELNKGRGTKDNPIPAGVPIVFKEFIVVPIYYIRPADTMVTEFSRLNRPTGDDSNYVLVRYNFECTKPSNTCNGDAFNSNLIDLDESEHGRPFGIRIDDDLDSQTMNPRQIYEGWMVYEFPNDSRITGLRVWTRDGTLYANVPPIQQPPSAENN